MHERKINARNKKRNISAEYITYSAIYHMQNHATLQTELYTACCPVLYKPLSMTKVTESVVVWMN